MNATTGFLDVVEAFEGLDARQASAEDGSVEGDIAATPISRTVSVILRDAIVANASALHLEPRGKETRIRYRIGGVLRTARTLPGYLHASIVSYLKALAKLDVDEIGAPQDGRITYVLDGAATAFHVSTLPVSEGEKIVLRALDASSGAQALEGLGFREPHRSRLVEEALKPHGMVVIAGSDRTGTSATLGALLHLLNGEGRHIATIEDPVERILPGVSHAQARPENRFGLAQGLQALLRQDPDVMMVGEISDRETAELAIHVSLTGRLILSALHTNAAADLVSRLAGFGVEPFLLSAALRLLVVQRFAPKVCASCKTRHDVPEHLHDAIRAALREIPPSLYPLETTADRPLVCFKGAGCARCSDTGFQGRTVISELTPVTPEIRWLIRQGSLDRLEEACRHQGSITMRQDALLKALEGSITLDEALL